MATLPNRLVVIENADKAWHEHWYKTRNPLNKPHPFRAIITGPPGVGKTCIIQNMLSRAQPPFQKVLVLHADPEQTKEYAGIKAEMMNSIPAPDSWDGEQKTLCIIDDLEIRQLSKEQKRNMERLFSYVSTHRNVSIILTSQDNFNIMPCVRRSANIFILFKIRDVDSLMCIARKIGIPKQMMRDLMGLLKKKHDSLWLDTTAGSPIPFALNGFTEISVDSSSDDDTDHEA